MTPPIRWGILGTGSIAHKFATGLAAVPDAKLIAVGSRTEAAAAQFGAQFNIPHRHGSYEALAADPEVDVVYISTPHPYHAANTLLCLNAGKAVLNEKPFTINAVEARRVIETARARGLFLMEAMWTRFVPVMREVARLLAEQAVGEVRMLTADFGFRADFDPKQRLFNPELGGGALLDVGIYPVSLASFVFGTQPQTIQSQALLGQTGVDEQSAMLYGYAGGGLALLSSAVRTRTPQEAVIAGSKGLIRIHTPWWIPRRFTLALDGQPEQTFEPDFVGNGYNYQAAEVGRCLRAGLIESPIMPLDETLAIMQTLDATRAPWGLVYPTEK